MSQPHLTEEEINARQKNLEDMGFSAENIKTLSEHTKILCDVDTVKRRMCHLAQFGFNVWAVISKNPETILDDCKTITRKFFATKMRFKRP